MKNPQADSSRRAVRGARAGAAVAIVGTFPPRRCGLATFTQDLLIAVRSADPPARVTVCAIRPRDFAEPFGGDVSIEIDQDAPGSYDRAAAALNERGVSVVCLQHEFGIFGGEAGNFILRFLDRLEAKVVTTLHSITPLFDAEQRRVVEKILQRSAKVIVMAEKGRAILINNFAADPALIEVIPHGAPARARPDTQACKRHLGFARRRVLMTFGLLGRGKGLETMIRAVPAIAASHPTVLYVVLGATHPNVIAAEGEAYRESLVALAENLGAAGNVVFIDKYLSLPELIDHLSAADIYVTPYLNKAQITSGTLAYAYCLGKPIVSTPYSHAVELLSGGRGALCEFNDSVAFATSITRLLNNPEAMEAMGAAAHDDAQSMHWPVVGKRYVDAFAAAGDVSIDRPRMLSTAGQHSLVRGRPSLAHLERMTDHVGLLQHAVMDAPNFQEGYCIDDNARALMLVTQFAEHGLHDEDCARLESLYAEFVQSAWNPTVGRFRNFMSFGGAWLEAQGSEDSHGRTLAALARACVFGSTSDRRAWAESLFHKAAPAADLLAAPRACAHALNALTFYDRHLPGRRDVRRRIERLANRLQRRLVAAASSDWRWFEDSLSYENAILPTALINAGVCLEKRVMLDNAIDSLEWLARMQATEDGWFRPVGTGSFGCAKRIPSHFDQQPIEAYAMIAAYEAARAATGDRRWIGAAETVFKWFDGWNDIGLPVYDAETGACHDGVHQDRLNANKGAESCLCALMAHLHIRAMRASAAPAKAPAAQSESKHAQLARTARV